MSKDDENYSKREALRRFMASLKAAVNTPPKPLKDKPRASGESRARKAKKKRT
jgi:hypothetical protein